MSLLTVRKKLYSSMSLEEVREQLQHCTYVAPIPARFRDIARSDLASKTYEFLGNFSETEGVKERQVESYLDDHFVFEFQEKDSFLSFPTTLRVPSLARGTAYCTPLRSGTLLKVTLFAPAKLGYFIFALCPIFGLLLAGVFVWPFPEGLRYWNETPARAAFLIIALCVVFLLPALYLFAFRFSAWRATRKIAAIVCAKEHRDNELLSTCP